MVFENFENFIKFTSSHLRILDIFLQIRYNNSIFIFSFQRQKKENNTMKKNRISLLLCAAVLALNVMSCGDAGTADT